MSSQPTRMVKCPRCKTEIPYSTENAFRPFCSERCRLIDLGQWASEGYRIPLHEQTPLQSPNFEDDEDVN